MARRDTRGLILQTSLALFNRLGEPNVTTNLIADEAEISPGNLYYHFRQKQDIVEALFSQFAERLLALIDLPEAHEIDAESLWFRLHLVFELKGEYRFVYRNLSDIAGRMPDVESAMRAVLNRERRAVGHLLEGLEASGQMTADAFERAMLLDQIMLTMTYWIPHADQFDPEGARDGSAQVRAISRVFLLVSPYLEQPWQEDTAGLAEDYLNTLRQ